MSILIKGIEMPKDGFITITVTSDGRVVGNSKKENGKFEYLDNEDIATAVPVPPHGRLTDADKLGFAMMDAANADQAMAMVDDAPTVIETEEVE